MTADGGEATTFSKGVMLCERPTNRTQTTAAQSGPSGGDGPAPFKAGLPTGANNQLGLQPAIDAHEHEREQFHKPGTDAITRHKRWLSRFNSLQMELRMVEGCEAAEKEEAAARMKDYCANLRKCILTSDEPVLHPGVRHTVEARERSLAMGTTAILDEFSNDGFLNLPKDSTIVKPPREDVDKLDSELMDFVNSAVQETKDPGTKKPDWKVQMEKSEQIKAEAAAKAAAEQAALDAELQALVDSSIQEAQAGKPKKEAHFAEPEQDVTVAPAEAPVGEVVERPPTAQGEEVRPGTGESQKAGKKSKGSKPAWAMSGGEAETREEEEEQELLNFVGGLDYDQYVQQCEDEDLQEAWKLMKEVEEMEANGQDYSNMDDTWKAKFVRAMNNLANREARDAPRKGSQAGSVGSQKSIAESAAEKALDRIAAIKASDKGSNWDSSSKMGYDDSVKLEKVAAAQALLSEDPEIRDVHSLKSVMSLIDKHQGVLPPVYEDFPRDN